VAKYAAKHEITVATSDLLEQQTVSSFGAVPISAELLREFIDEARGDLARRLKHIAASSERGTAVTRRPWRLSGRRASFFNRSRIFHEQLDVVGTALARWAFSSAFFLPNAMSVFIGLTTKKKMTAAVMRKFSVCGNDQADIEDRRF